ncbi:MAG: cation-translocating P-type ATPase [Fulvimonas sp.]|nr:cation-translocating P-type ATPase [Fulvimonas sp.]
MIHPDQPDWHDVRGLGRAEAAARLREEGYNELPGSRHRSLFALILEVLREPMLLLLVAAAGIYFILGDAREAAVLLASVLGVMALTLYQEQRTERVLEALRELSSPRALVVRDGELVRIAGREVVRGDIVLLGEGDRVPADAVVLAQRNLVLDESLLTGESTPVHKRARTAGEAASPPPRPGGDDLPYVWSGTLVVQGSALVEVTATGPRSELGRIGKSLQSLSAEPSPLQRQTRMLVRSFALAGLGLCVLLVLAHGLLRDGWLAGLLAGITLAMAILPEEIPVVLTVFLALGAWRLSRRHVLARRAAAVETLGAASVLCVDKTGTLTLNRMRVHSLVVGEASFRIPAEGGAALPVVFAPLLEHAVLACEPEPVDPMERTLHESGRRYLASDRRFADWTLQHAYPLTRTRRAVALVWTRPEGGGVVAAKGAPEAIAALCRLDPTATSALLAKVEALAAQGLRVLGVAKAEVAGNGPWPADPRDFAFRLLGLVAFVDPLRPTVPAAIAECKAAGIRVVMITGDYPGTALAIAREAGLDAGAVLTGEALDALDEPALRTQLARVSVFARVVPEQKLRLVEAFKAMGEVVAMTGDGVNDAPALKSAHIGIAMGQRGTDVAREAAALVLLDDDFSTIVEAVRLGRRIDDNLRKAMAYILAVHVPTAGMALLPVLLGWPVLFFPIHVAFLEFVIDPACSIVFEAEPAEDDLMRRPPRPARRPLFGRRILALSLLQGLGMFVLTLIVYALGLHQGEGQARALAFTTLVVGNLALILTNRSWAHTLPATLGRRNAALWWVVGGTLLALALALALPALRGLFRFAMPTPSALALAVVAGLAGIAWFEAFKWLHRRNPDRPGTRAA